VTLGPRVTVELGRIGARLSVRGGAEMRRRFDAILGDGSVVQRDLDRTRMLQFSVLYGHAPGLNDLDLVQGWR